MKTSWIVSRIKDKVTKFVPGTTFRNGNAWPYADIDGAPALLDPSAATRWSKTPFLHPSSLKQKGPHDCAGLFKASSGLGGLQISRVVVRES